jgi:hypothetical protein
VNRARRRLTSLTAVLLSGALAVGATSALGTSKVIGHGVRLKGTHLWYAQGEAVSPKTISASVVAVPEQAVKVQWSVVCQKPNKTDPAVDLAASERSGQASVHGATTVKLALPYAKPPTCIVTLYATLATNGSLTLRLQQT